MSFDIIGLTNVCRIGDGVKVVGYIKGEGNSLIIDSPLHECSIDLRISGDHNVINIASCFAIKGLSIRVGNHVKAHKCKINIGKNFSIESHGNFILPNSGNVLAIGDNCMFSNMVTIRCGDSPHLLFDMISGDYIDTSDGVFIGDHVWVGERVYITKKVSLPNDSLAAACAVVTKRFSENNIVLAGNPAKVVRRNVQWIRNHSILEKESLYRSSYLNRQRLFE